MDEHRAVTPHSAAQPLGISRSGIANAAAVTVRVTPHPGQLEDRLAR
jgi:hypothetical protein